MCLSLLMGVVLLLSVALTQMLKVNHKLKEKMLSLKNLILEEYQIFYKIQTYFFLLYPKQK